MKNIEALISELSVEEKAALLSGTNSMRTNAVPRLGIPQLLFSDGPHGLRKISGDNIDGIAESEPATSFPTSATIASGWNEENAYLVGEAIAKEALGCGVNVVLGPGVNIKRDPRCGRNFEYYSEDPLLAGKTGSAFVRGVQSKGVGVSVKHFAANNGENYRYMGDSLVDERALREIYLRAFERIVKEQKPYTLMCAYNKLSGTFCASSRRLLTQMLREEWGFDGLVMSDWGAVQDRCESVLAGLDLEMPGDVAYFRKQIIDSVKSGRLPMEQLDKAVRNVLNLITRCLAQRGEKADFDAHHELAAKIAADCAVLLKNDGALPLSVKGRYLIAGQMFENMRYQGSGSSLVNPTRITAPKQAFDSRGINYTTEIGEADSCDAIIFFGGLTEDYEMEGGDREDIAFPKEQLDLLSTLLGTGKPVVVVLFGGSPMELPFEDSVSAILNMYLPGQNGGEAAAALLFGEINPSGKLAETWPARCEDIPYHDSYSKSETELYRESIYVGYRYYDTAQKKVRYPFGFGLSYTTFEYGDVSVEESGGNVTVRCSVSNIGSRGGAEVVQLYVKNPASRVFKAEKELRGFAKVYLEAGESKSVEITFARADLSYYDVGQNAWVLENGVYEIMLGASSRDIRLSAPFAVSGEPEMPCPYGGDVMAAYTDVSHFSVSDEVFSHLIGRELPSPPEKLPLTMESRFSDFNQTIMGRILYNAVTGLSKRQYKKARKLPPGPARDNLNKTARFLKTVFDSNSMRSLSASSSGVFAYNVAEGFVELANGHIFRGIARMCKGYKAPKLPGRKAKKAR